MKERKLGEIPMAARVEIVTEMLKGPVLRYCDCKPDCDIVLERGAPLISAEDALKALEFPEVPK